MLVDRIDAIWVLLDSIPPLALIVAALCLIGVILQGVWVVITSVLTRAWPPRP